MTAIGPVTELVIKKRLRLRSVELDRPGIVWAATWSPDTGIVAMNEGADPDDYTEALAIFNATVGEGERRYKTNGEFYTDFNAYPSAAIDALRRWASVIHLRNWALERPELFDEALAQTALELSITVPEIYAQLLAAGMLTFDPTTTAPEPTP